MYTQDIEKQINQACILAFGDDIKTLRDYNNLKFKIIAYYIRKRYGISFEEISKISRISKKIAIRAVNDIENKINQGDSYVIGKLDTIAKSKLNIPASKKENKAYVFFHERTGKVKFEKNQQSFIVKLMEAYAQYRIEQAEELKCCNCFVEKRKIETK